MTMKLTLNNDLSAFVEEEARRRDLKPEAFVETVLAEAMSHESTMSSKARSLRLLDEVRNMGDEAEQRETFDFLKDALNEDALSNRRRFA